MSHEQRGRAPDPLQRFTSTVSVDRQGRTHVPVPFDPDTVWGAEPRHHVTGSVAGCSMRGVLDKTDGGPVLVLGPAWNRGGGPTDGATDDVRSSVRRGSPR
jgi:hypothetical protein